MALEITSFATRRKGDGRVDNVIRKASTAAVPLLTIHSRSRFRLDGQTITLYGAPFLVLDRRAQLRDLGSAWQVQFPPAPAGTPILLRFPQDQEALLPAAPEELLAEARTWWKAWRPFGADLD